MQQTVNAHFFKNNKRSLRQPSAPPCRQTDAFGSDLKELAAMNAWQQSKQQFADTLYVKEFVARTKHEVEPQLTSRTGPLNLFHSHYLTHSPQKNAFIANSSHQNSDLLGLRPESTRLES